MNQHSVNYILKKIKLPTCFFIQGEEFQEQF